MITDKGKGIVAKYMLGQAPEFAAYIAVGTGGYPAWGIGDLPTDISRKRLQFEAFRVPVLSKGLVNDTITVGVQTWIASSNSVEILLNESHGILVGDEITVSVSSTDDSAKAGTFVVTSTTSNTITYSQEIGDESWSADAPSHTMNVIYVRERLIFKAQLPPDQFYKMSEVGIYPAANNQLALGFDSRQLAAFLPTEGWFRHDTTDTTIDYTTESLCDIDGVYTPTSASINFVNTNNELFTHSSRYSDGGPRFMNKTLLVPGNLTSFADDFGGIVGTQPSVRTSNLAFDFSKNSKDDEITLAFAVIQADPHNYMTAKIRLRITFTDSMGWIAHAYKTISPLDSDYMTWVMKLSDFESDGDFSWARISSTDIYIQTLDDSNSYDNAIVVLDGLRFDNINTENPLYGLVAYSLLPYTSSNSMIEKSENSQGYIEYRMGVSIV